MCRQETVHLLTRSADQSQAPKTSQFGRCQSPQCSGGSFVVRAESISGCGDCVCVCVCACGRAHPRDRRGVCRVAIAYDRRDKRTNYITASGRATGMSSVMNVAYRSPVARAQSILSTDVTPVGRMPGYLFPSIQWPAAASNRSTGRRPSREILRQNERL